MPTFRIWYIAHSLTAKERDKLLRYQADPEKYHSPKIRYRKQRKVKDVEAETEADAVNSIKSVPENEGDPFNRIWGSCLATDHAAIVYIDGMFKAEEVDLFAEEELKKCER